MNTTNPERLVQACKDSLGQNLSIGTGVDSHVACAISVNKVHFKAFGFPIGGGASTHDMYAALQKSPYFKQVTKPAPGCVVISPTGYGTNPAYPHGHVGIVCHYGICANDSSTGLFSENYTTKTWNDFFHNKEGYPVYYFQRI